MTFTEVDEDCFTTMILISEIAFFFYRRDQEQKHFYS